MEGYIGQVILFAGNFAPTNWAFCDGRLLSISHNTALFSILGTTYGGDGVTTFALPDMRGRVAISPGQAPGLSDYALGQMSGTENVTLLSTEMPQHVHEFALRAESGSGNESSPLNHFPAAITDNSGNEYFAYSNTANGVMQGGVSSIAGGNQPHPNLQPYLCLNFIICVLGIFPSHG